MLLFKIIDFQPRNLEQFCRITNKEGAVQLLCYEFDIVQSIFQADHCARHADHAPRADELKFNNYIFFKFIFWTDCYLTWGSQAVMFININIRQIEIRWNDRLSAAQ